MANIKVGDEVRLNVENLLQKLDGETFPITRKVLTDVPDKIYKVTRVLKSHGMRIEINMDVIGAISTYEVDELIKVEDDVKVQKIKVGDKVKINFDVLKECHISPKTYDTLKSNPDAEFTVLEIFTSNYDFPIKINTKDVFKRDAVDMFKESELILVESVTESTEEVKPVEKVEIKEGLQVKINHEVLEKRIDKLKLDFIGHLKINPNHIYTVIKAQNSCKDFPVGCIHNGKVLREYLYEDEVIVVDGEKL